MSADLTLTSAREERDALASRTDVLDKVKVLRTLPDDMHVTTEMVAEFYEVPKETIFTLVRNNRDELEEDGYRVVTRSAFEETFDSKVPSSASRIALFPRRAVLRVGMLLRDSLVARKVRDYLLDAEHEDRLDLDDPIGALERMHTQTGRAIALAKAERDRADRAELQIAADRPMVERAKQHAGGSGMESRTQFFREVKAWAQKNHGVLVKLDEVTAFLSTQKLGLFVRGQRGDAGEATAWAIEKGYADNVKGTTKKGRNYATGKLLPLGQQYAWERIVRHIDANGTLELPRQIGKSTQVAQVVDADKPAAQDQFADADNMMLPGMEGSA